MDGSVIVQMIPSENRRRDDVYWPVFLTYMTGELYLPGPLYKHSLGHWSTTIEGLAQNVLKVTAHLARI